MSSHITSVSLDSESAILATRMKREGKNFSGFVQHALRIYYSEVRVEHDSNQVVWENLEPFCLPIRKEYCSICWPAGPPTREQWRQALTHVSQLNTVRNSTSKWAAFDEGGLIDGLYRKEGGQVHADLEPQVLEWILARAEEENKHLIRLKELDLIGNRKAAKTKKPRRGLIGLFRKIIGQ